MYHSKQFLGVPLRRPSWRRAFAGTRYLGSIAHAGDVGWEDWGFSVGL